VGSWKPEAIVVEIRIGISGWRYAPWRGTFYTRGWPQRRELEYAARHVNSVELIGSFSSLQRTERRRNPPIPSTKAK
jgi:uncharacterized protein YecE (DUF72 family)